MRQKQRRYCPHCSRPPYAPLVGLVLSPSSFTGCGGSLTGLGGSFMGLGGSLTDWGSSFTGLGGSLTDGETLEQICFKTEFQNNKILS